jgi:hypothetical protein
VTPLTGNLTTTGLPQGPVVVAPGGGGTCGAQGGERAQGVVVAEVGVGVVVVVVAGTSPHTT